MAPKAMLKRPAGASWAKADSKAAPTRRIRSKQMVADIGYDTEGNALPTNNQQPYNKVQKYVFDKVKDQLPEDIKATYDAAVASKDRAAQCAVVNSVAPPDSSYALSINLGDGKAEEWQKRIIGQKKTEAQVITSGCTYTQMLGQCAGSVQLLNEGIQRKDIREGSDGLFYWVQKKGIQSNSKTEQLSHSILGDMTDGNREDLLKHIGTYASTDFLNWGGEKLAIGDISAGSSKAPKALEDAPPNVSQGEALQKLQEAYEAADHCSREVHKACSQLREEQSKSTTIRDLVSRSVALNGAVQADMVKMQVMLVDQHATIKAIKDLLQETSADFLQLAVAEKELKLFTKKAKVMKRPAAP